MNKMLNNGLALTLLAIGSISASADTDLYIDDISGKIGYVDLTTQHVTVLGSSGVSISDIGFTSNGTLYGSTATGLYTINKTSGVASFDGSFGGVGGNQIFGLVGYGTGLLASSATNTGIYAIDTSPFGITTLSGVVGHTQGDLTFGANGALYDVLRTGALDKLVLSGNSFTASPVGNTHVAGSTSIINISGLATASNGTSYAVAGTEIYAIDLNTAVLTPLFSYAGSGLGTDAGAAIALAVPEPSSVALLLAGLVGVVFYQMRRRVTVNAVA